MCRARRLLLPLLASIALGCGGQTSAGATRDGGTGSGDAQGSPDGGDAAADAPVAVEASADAARPQPTPDGGCILPVPTDHRPSATSCPAGGGACAVDSDCTAADGVCACGGQVPGGNMCVYGNCRVDADCGNGNFCSPSPSTGCSYPACGGFYCHTCQDSCTNYADCPGGYDCGWTLGGWACIPVPNTG